MLRLVKNAGFLAAFAGVLSHLGALRTDAAGSHVDAAGDTMHLARELEYVSAQTYDVLKDPIKGRTLVPISWEVPDGAENYSYDMYDGFALAEWITDYSSAVGQADAFKVRTSKPMRDFGSSYQYSDQDLAASSFAGGRPLDRERARMVRIAHEQFLDDVIAVGDTTRSIEGLTNSTVIPLVAPATGTWDASTTIAQLYADLDKLCQAPEQATAEQFKADTLVLPLSVKPLLTKPFSDSVTQTVLGVWLANQETIKKVVFWKRLNTASVAGGPRALAYKMDPAVVQFLGSYDYREKPPQEKNYAVQILTKARVLGLCIRYPLAMAQMDLDASP